MEVNYKLWHSTKSDDYWIVDSSTPWHYSRAMTVQDFVDKVVYKRKVRMGDLPTRNFINLDKFVPGNLDFKNSIDITLLSSGCVVRLQSYNGFKSTEIVNSVVALNKQELEKYINKFISLRSMM